MFWFIAIAGALALILWYYYYFKPFSYWKKLGVQQISSPWIFLGDFWPVFAGKMNFGDLMDKFYYKRPNTRYDALYHLSIPTLVIRDPELIKQVLVKDFDHFIDHINIAPSEDPDGLWSQNLLALRGKRWRDMRSVLSGTFTSSKMRIMYNLIMEASEDFTNYFLEKDEDFIEVELKESFTRLTTDVIATTAFGLKVDSMKDPQNKFYLMGKEATDLTGIVIVIKFFLTFICPWLFRLLKIGFFPKRVTNFFYDLIDDTLKIREEQGIERPDLLHLLLKLKKTAPVEEQEPPTTDGFDIVKETSDSVKPQKQHIQITNKEIAAQAVAFFIAGFDSVTSAMCFTAYELAVNPDIQEKLRKEIEETLENCGGKITYEALLGMKYLDMVVTESLRKWPPIPATDRECIKSYTINPTTPEEIPITLLPDQRIIIPIVSIHHDPKYYPEPEKFIPERFSDENKSNMHPYTFLPFGVGPRGCIGFRLALLETKLILFHLLKNFEIVPTEKTPIPLKLSKKSLIVSVDGGFPFGLKRIHN